MREILFRGVNKNNRQQWIYGSLTPNYHIMTKEHRFWYKTTPVIPKSIGEYSGRRDINKVRIFENDIVYIYDEDKYATIKFQDGTFVAILEDGSGLALCALDKVKVIGNSYEI